MRTASGRLVLPVATMLFIGALGFLAHTVWQQFVSPVGLQAAIAEERTVMARQLGARSVEQYDLADLKLPKDEILSGGPGKDVIPSLVRPKVVPLAGAGFLGPDDRLVGVTVGGESRAYPVPILNWHECVNDELGGVPIAVVFCPLCDSVSVLDRRHDGRTYEFGITGLLHDSNVIMYDRAENALWSQMSLGAVSGPRAGTALRHLPFAVTTVERWREKHPDSTVLSLATGYTRSYEISPYREYLEDPKRLLFPVKPQDDRLPLKERVIGVREGSTAIAFPVAAIVTKPDGVLRYDLARGTLVLEAANDGSVEVAELPPGASVVHTFWFAWAAFHPETGIEGTNR